MFSIERRYICTIYIKEHIKYNHTNIGYWCIRMYTTQCKWQCMPIYNYYMVCVHQQIWQLNLGNLGERGNTTQQSTAIHPRHGTHRCKQPASPSCSLGQPLCTRTFHLGFVRNCGSWDMLSYHHQQLVDSPHPHRPSIPVGLVGCTTLLKWALVLWLVRSTLCHSLRRSASPSMVCQTGECGHTAGKLQTLQCERRRQEEQLNRGVECNK